MANISSDKNKKMTTTYCHLMLLLLFVPRCCAQKRNIINNKNLEIQIQQELDRLNKPVVKSIESADGDIIDCVLITQQLAFDHPLLQNHTIQMRPTYHPEGLSMDDMGNILDMNSDNSRKNDASGLMTQLWQLNGSCPEGTIPIRRTKREDLLRAYSTSSFGKKNSKAFPPPVASDGPSQNGHEYALTFVQGETYHGAKANINVWNPTVQDGSEFSLSQIWVLGGIIDSRFAPDLNSIEAGWQVSHHLYGDDRTRFFIYWTADGYKSKGCYNLLCSGFIQTNRKISLGGAISPISTYQGHQYIITLLIWKDPKSNNWWLQYGKEILGYWPVNLFRYLGDGATAIEWGGEIVNSRPDGRHTNTAMGSGHFPTEGFGRASYFSNVQAIDTTDKLKNPANLDIINDHNNCYSVKIDSTSDTGIKFYYGGPGGKNGACQ